MTPSFAPKLPPGVRRLFRLPESREHLLREMDDEMRAHLAMRADELRALGVDDAQAEAEARRRFGDADDYRRHAERRAKRRGRRGAARWLAELAHDARVAARQFRAARALALLVVLTLALCIGLTTAAYGVLRHWLLAPLPYADGNRIVSLEAPHPDEGGFREGMSAELVRTWFARARTLEAFAAATPWQHRALGPLGAVGGVGAGAADTVETVFVTPSLLPMLRVRPALGRGFTAADVRPGAPAVALLDDGVWRRRFGADPGVVGRAITVDGAPCTVVGVLPRGAVIPLQGEAPTDLWLPLDLASAHGVNAAFARLRPGVGSADATRELQAILRSFPDTGWLRGRRAAARTAPEQLGPERARAVQVLFAAAAALLLVACADVAALLLARGWGRRREFAVRRALGAWRGRLARQLLTESLLLAAPGGALGLLVAWVALRAVLALRPGVLDTVPLDGATLVWTAATSLTTAVLFGVGPALLAGGRSVDAALRADGERGGPGRAAGRAHAALVVGQIALSLMFAATAGVLLRSFVALVRTPLGYEPAGLVAVRVRPLRPPSVRAAHDTAVAGGATAAGDAVARAVRAALSVTPGVREVAIGTLPLTNVGIGPTAVDGAGGARPVAVPLTGVAYVSPEYFRVTRIALRRGRGFDGDPAAASAEVVINGALARRLWPAGDALGARLRLGGETRGRWLTVVGIAEDVRMPGRAAGFFGLQMYRPTGAAGAAGAAGAVAGTLVVRADGAPSALRPLLARAVERAGVGVALDDVVAAESTLEFAFGGPRFAAALFGTFAALAVALAAVGLFGVVADAVARRTREIGIRVALGADPGRLARAILGQSVRLTAAGCAVGLVGAYAASRGLTALVYGVRPADPVSLGGGVGLLAAVALAATALPLRRALRVNPADTLRAE